MVALVCGSDSRVSGQTDLFKEQSNDSLRITEQLKQTIHTDRAVNYNPCDACAHPFLFCNHTKGESDGSFLPARQREWEFLFSGTLSDLSQGCMPRNVMMLLTASVLRGQMQQYQESSAQGSASVPAGAEEGSHQTRTRLTQMMKTAKWFMEYLKKRDNSGIINTSIRFHPAIHRWQNCSHLREFWQN